MAGFGARSLAPNDVTVLLCLNNLSVDGWEVPIGAESMSNVTAGSSNRCASSINFCKEGLQCDEMLLLG